MPAARRRQDAGRAPDRGAARRSASTTSSWSSAARPRQSGGRCGQRITYIENTRFAQTNSLYSLWLARPLLYDGFVVMNCDVLFHPQMLVGPGDLASRGRAAHRLSGRRREPLGDEEMKIKVRRGRVIDIAKTMPADEADGENVGIVKFGARRRAAAGEPAGPARRRRRPARLGAESVRRFRARAAAARGRHARAIRGPRSTFPRITSAPCATSCRRSRARTSRHRRSPPVAEHHGHRTADATIVVRGVRLRPARTRCRCRPSGE